MTPLRWHRNGTSHLGVGIDNMKKILKTALRKLRQSLRMDGYETAGTAKEGHR
ncbi:hypothetical protein [Streptomyces sp. SAS_272]|uniref:hypothetical protein n=1 Tax=Streptomyces sp. SAS_272 TaxID=3412747 RepID=UPI00403C8FD9